MATIKKCDMCGKQIIPLQSDQTQFKLRRRRVYMWSAEFELHESGIELFYDLCDDCAKEIRRHISGEEKGK